MSLMSSCYELISRIREYAWGHPAHIPALLGLPVAADRPAAELWMGAHPGDPSSLVLENGEKIPLDRWIRTHPHQALGPHVTGKYGDLPFLFKLLAAGRALSIQAHPSKIDAESGFGREEELGIPIQSPQRNYRDRNHKPEIIMALTPFTAMIGFRSPDAILKNMIPLGPAADPLRRPVTSPGATEGSALSGFLETLLTLDPDRVAGLLDAALSFAGMEDSRRGAWPDLQRKWIRELSRQYPGDIGVLAPLFLNIVMIPPGRALYQGAGVLHAYLEGFGVELMANSDNVLRGGLTPKHVDVRELLRVLTFRSFLPEILDSSMDSSTGIRWFETPAEEFRLGLADCGEQGEHCIRASSGPLILIVLEGALNLDDRKSRRVLQSGHSVFVPWDAPDIFLSGSCRAAVAAVGG